MSEMRGGGDGGCGIPVLTLGLGPPTKSRRAEVRRSPWSPHEDLWNALRARPRISDPNLAASGLFVCIRTAHVPVPMCARACIWHEPRPFFPEKKIEKVRNKKRC